MIRLESVVVRVANRRFGPWSWDIPAGVWGNLSGPNGGGKTTLLETIAGLRLIEGGRIWLGGVEVTSLPAAARGVGYLPQDIALFGRLTVAENLGFGLTVRGASRGERRRIVGELAERLGLVAHLRRRADRLSGGEAQRVALGRALAFRPAVLLLDEPLSAQDAEGAARVAELLVEHQARGAAGLVVSHGAAPPGLRLVGRAVGELIL